MKKQLLKIVAIATVIMTGSFQATKAQTNTFPATGSVGVGTLAPNASAIMDLTSTTQGALLPRMTSAQKSAIVTPATGLLIYQTDGTKGIYMYSGTGWYPVSTSVATLATKALNNLAAVAINTSLTPATTNSIDLGSATKYWKDLYLSGNANISGNSQFTGTISVGGNTVLNRDLYVSGTTTSGGNIAFNNSAANTIQFASPIVGGNAMLNMFPSGIQNPDRMVLGHSPSFPNWGLQYQDATDKFNFLSDSFPVLTADLGGRKVGIGTNAPAYQLDINGRMRLRTENFGAGLTAGIWYNKADNSGVANFVGNLNDSLFGIYGNTSGWRFFFDHKNGNMGIGTSNPKVALSFPAATGKKISLYPGGSGDVGMGVYGNEFRLHSDYSGADITFGYDNYTNGFTERMRVKGDGRVCIGTTSPANGYLLSVNGKVIATEVRVESKVNWPDYVFNNDYKLLSLEELEASINANKHLPGIPSASEIKEGGIMLGDMQTKTIEKVEENTLYIIELNKKIKLLEDKIELLTKAVK